MKFGKILKGLEDDHFDRKVIAQSTGHERAKQLPKMIFKQGEPRSINNLYTGYGLTTTAKVAVGVAGVAYGANAIYGIDGHMKSKARKAKVEADSQETEVEASLSSQSDGVGYSTSDLVQSAQASSGLVFAMNKTRQGGYL